MPDLLLARAALLEIHPEQAVLQLLRARPAWLEIRRLLAAQQRWQNPAQLFLRRELEVVALL